MMQDEGLIDDLISSGLNNDHMETRVVEDRVNILPSMG